MSNSQNRKITPLMKQYHQVKAKYPDTILLFRLGDFYETFEEDAKITSKILGITLTKRGNGAAGETPLAGFPYHALENYLPKLLKAGKKVAICEQLEDPKFAKGIVKRDVIEVVTPGVAFSEKILESKQNNFIAAVYLPSPLITGNDYIGFSFADVSTGEFYTTEILLKSLQDLIQNLKPSELLVQKRDFDTLQNLLRNSYNGIFTKLDDWILNFEYCYELLINQFKTQTLKGFGVEDYKLGITAAGALLSYLNQTQKENLSHLRKIISYDFNDYITLDPSTKKNLEIIKSIDGKEEGTLFWVIDKTKTPMGGRLLKKWINQPLKKIDQILYRQNAIKELVGTNRLRNNLLEVLDNFGDLERLIAKICTARANARDLIALKNNLSYIDTLLSFLNEVKSETLKFISNNLNSFPSLINEIEQTIVEDPPTSITEGGLIRKGCNPELDELREISHNGKNWIANLQQKERERTGINSLKVGYNNVFGYYIEVTHTHKNKIPTDYIRKQTLTNAERYITPELKEYEEKILTAEEKIVQLEIEIFNELRSKVASEAEKIQKNAALIAELDVYVSLAETAVEHEYTCPVLTEDNKIIIKSGRHPVIERLLPPGEEYTANDTILDTDENQILIITGPNMSGKSSYLRQVGLIVLLAQIGSYIPAKEAHIGIVDKIFTRVGASDNITSGESTFLVEMHEAAHIINNATNKSLILLDEIGRGTSTFDGISIAWALTEYIHNKIGARTLFATHYHELNELADLYTKIKNYKVEVREYHDKVIFLHKLSPGFADHSYGIQVAQMAGLPDEITERAKRILQNLEGSELNLSDKSKKGRIAPNEIQLTLFEIKDDKLREEIRKIEIEKLTPLEALQKLAELKKKTENS